MSQVSLTLRSYSCQTDTLLGANFSAVAGPKVYISLVTVNLLIRPKIIIWCNSLSLSHFYDA